MKSSDKPFSNWFLRGRWLPLFTKKFQLFLIRFSFLVEKKYFSISKVPQKPQAMSRILLLAIALCVFVSVKSQSEKSPAPAPFTMNPCTSKTTCSQCIQTQKCAWCMQENFGDRPRCFQPDFKVGVACDEAFTINPDNEQSFEKDNPLSRGGFAIGGNQEEGEEYSQASMASGGSGYASASGSVTQIRPQHVNLKLRISEREILKHS